jgi:hypothetical protein
MSVTHRSLSDQLIKTIESHAEALARGAVAKLQGSRRTNSFQRLSYDELYFRIYQVYHELGLWLQTKSDYEIHCWYVELGEKRFNEGMPLEEVLWALVLEKYYVCDYLHTFATTNSAMELYQQQEFDRLIGQFFDRAGCYTAEGYEHQASLQRRGAATITH